MFDRGLDGKKKSIRKVGSDWGGEKVKGGSDCSQGKILLSFYLVADYLFPTKTLRSHRLMKWSPSLVLSLKKTTSTTTSIQYLRWIHWSFLNFLFYSSSPSHNADLSTEGKGEKILRLVRSWPTIYFASVRFISESMKAFSQFSFTRTQVTERLFVVPKFSAEFRVMNESRLVLYSRWLQRVTSGCGMLSPKKCFLLLTRNPVDFFGLSSYILMMNDDAA